MLFSVIIPLYNKENFIADTIQAVLKQTCRDFELIVVDDGSTDASVSKVLEIADPRVRLLCQDNHGVSGARNKGINTAQGDFLAFCDADDIWNPCHLEDLAMAIDENPNEVFFFTDSCLGKGSEAIDQFRHQPHSNHRRTTILKENFFIAFRKNIRPNSSSFAIARKFVVEHRIAYPEKLSHGEDICFYWRCTRHVTSIIHVGSMSVMYRVGSGENVTDQDCSPEKSFNWHLPFSEAASTEEHEFLQTIYNNTAWGHLRHWRIRKLCSYVNHYPWRHVFSFIAYAVRRSVRRCHK